MKTERQGYLTRSSEWEGYPTIPMDFYQHVLKYRLHDFMMDEDFAKRVMDEVRRLYEPTK